ncbi:Poly [ADP-ribose] polymerase tankyrase-1 [Manis javanica]|nr:Poly [ADP-ribose] polymerase tankyrase-1 [Manis javanica]
MSATHPTRLETRTKESNTCASQGLVESTDGANEGHSCTSAPRPGRVDQRAERARVRRVTCTGTAMDVGRLAMTSRAGKGRRYEPRNLWTGWKPARVITLLLFPALHVTAPRRLRRPETE